MGPKFIISPLLTHYLVCVLWNTNDIQCVRIASVVLLMTTAASTTLKWSVYENVAVSLYS